MDQNAITQWIKASAITCAILDFIGIAKMKLVISQAMTNRYVKSSNPFDINLMSSDKLFIRQERTSGLGEYGLCDRNLFFFFDECHKL